MDSPKKRLRSQASKSSVPEQNPHPHTSRKKKVRRSTVDYASRTDEKGYRPAHGQSCPSKKPKKTSVIVPRPDSETKNLRDPFSVLDDDAVFLIIDQVSPRDTETLRRVSKLWKASSEAHCGRNALMKHFPLAAANLEERGSRAEENLRFRRHCTYELANQSQPKALTLTEVHYHESLAIGNATRAIRCTGALDWHLERDTLVWSNKTGNFSIRTLRSRNDNLPTTAPATCFDFRSFKIPFVPMSSVQLTEDGNLIVDLQGDASSPLSSDWRWVQKLLKMTRQGVVLWEMVSTSSISVPAITKNDLYFVEHSLSPATSEPVVAFVKMSLEDGSISYRIQLPDRYCMAQPNRSDRNLRLFSDEAFAVWRDDRNLAFVFSTKTGQVLQVYPRTTRTPPVVGRQSSFVWDINPNLLNPPADIYSFWPDPRPLQTFSQRVTFQEAAPVVKFEAISFPHRIRSRYPHSEWRFSGDHFAFFYFTHVVLANVDFDRRFLGQNEPTDPCTNVWVSMMEKFPSDQPDFFEMKEKASAVQISLPSRSERLGCRRPLELALPWKMNEHDYLGMVNDYMIYHSREQEILLLVDFWPNW